MRQNKDLFLKVTEIHNIAGKTNSGFILFLSRHKEDDVLHIMLLGELTGSFYSQVDCHGCNADLKVLQNTYELFFAGLTALTTFLNVIRRVEQK